MMFVIMCNATLNAANRTPSQAIADNDERWAEAGGAEIAVVLMGIVFVEDTCPSRFSSSKWNAEIAGDTEDRLIYGNVAGLWSPSGHNPASPLGNLSAQAAWKCARIDSTWGLRNVCRSTFP